MKDDSRRLGSFYMQRLAKIVQSETEVVSQRCIIYKVHAEEGGLGAGIRQTV